MPEIKIKYVVSFSSEDKVHKAENLTKPETYRKWKCATPGAKSATIVLQFEKATQINSIDIGNESSAFVEVLVGRSSDSVSDFKVLLVASSFMSPLESRNGTQTNRVRMFGPEKLSQHTKDEKWDCVQVICTQPFNKSLQYGLTFIKFHSPSEKIEEQSKSLEAQTTTEKIGAFKLRFEDDEESSLPVGSWFGKQKTQVSQSPSNSPVDQTSPSYAAAILATASNSSVLSPQNNTKKRKLDETSNLSHEPPTKKASAADTMNKDHIVYKDVLRDTKESKKKFKQDVSVLKTSEMEKTTALAPSNKTNAIKNPTASASSTKPNKNPVVKLKPKAPFEKILEKVVFVLSGFVNPLRSELREKALEMGAKYKADWDSSCTHLVCAFSNTPKYTQVNKLKGRIVRKEWILDCYKKREQLRWTRYMLGKLSRDESDYSDEEYDFSAESEELYSEEELDSEEEYVDKRKKRNKNNVKPKNKPATVTQPSTPINNTVSSALKNKNNTNTSIKRDYSISVNKIGISTPGNVFDSPESPTLLVAKDESETDDEEALHDYMANTDVESDSGGDTEDEIRKVEMKAQQNGKNSPKKAKASKEAPEYSEKPDVTYLPLPELPNLFKQKHFFLFGEFSSSKRHDMERFIIAYNGVLEDYMSDEIKYVITEAKWDKHFEDAVSENEDLIFVKPTWIYKCHETGKLVPYQPYIVIPDS